MISAVARFPRLSASRVERTLAALLVGLLGTYVLGQVVRGVAPPVETAGVVAVHLALVVGFTFPFAVLGHATYGKLRPNRTGLPPVEVGTAAVALCSFVAALWIATDPASTLDTPLFAAGACALFVLVGLVARRP